MDALKRPGVPESPTRPAPGGEELAVRAETHLHFPAELLVQTMDLLPLTEIPDQNALAFPPIAAGHELLAVGAEGHSDGSALVAYQGLEGRARVRIPHADRPVLRRGGQSLAVAVEGRPDRPLGVPLQHEQLVTGLHVVDRDEQGRVHIRNLRQPAGGDGESLAVRAERGVVNVGGGRPDTANELAGFCVEEPNVRPVGDGQQLAVRADGGIPPRPVVRQGDSR